MDILSTLAIIIPIISSIVSLGYWFGKKFTKIEVKLAEHDKRFDDIEAKLAEHDKRFEVIENKLAEHDKRFDDIEAKLAEHDKRFDKAEANFIRYDEEFRKIDKRFRELNSKIDETKTVLENRVRRLGEAFSSYQEFFIEFLVTENVIGYSKGVLLKGEARRLIKLAITNPFTKEELKRLEELLDKDELNLDEALELRRLARKAIREYWDRPEAWKLHIYASIMVGLAIKKMSKEELLKYIKSDKF